MWKKWKKKKRKMKKFQSKTQPAKNYLPLKKKKLFINIWSALGFMLFIPVDKRIYEKYCSPWKKEEVGRDIFVM